MMADNLLLTTADSLEGYTIVEQCGLVFGEHFFSHPFEAPRGPGVTSIDIYSRQYSTTRNLIDKAKEIACSRMVEKAVSYGANAVIAIKTDNSFTDNFMYFSLCGTAVKVYRTEEKEAFERQEAERKKAEEKRSIMEKQRAEEERKIRIKKHRANFISGEKLPEEEFIEEISVQVSMMKIWTKWSEYNLKEIFPEVDEFIFNKKEVERIYGKGDVNYMKKKIIKMLRE